MQTRMCSVGLMVVALSGALWGSNTTAFGAPFVELNPARDGTILDGGNYPFDGVPDEADWYFTNPPSSYEGAITLATAASQLEHRLVWEYSLTFASSFTPPVTARLSFTLRGAPAFPRSDVDVHVYNYPADLVESLSDFSSTPAVFQDHVIVAPFQPSTDFVIDVSHAVSQALADGAAGVAFRFQVDPLSSHTINQAFMDAYDSPADTKPVLTVIDALPADADGSGLVDLDDYDWFEFCLSGPGSPTPDDEMCKPLRVNFDNAADDNDLDLRDFAAFQNFLGLHR